jgi:hypothetical protein
LFDAAAIGNGSNKETPMSRIKTMSVALSLAAAAILTASSAGAAMPGLAGLAPAAAEFNDLAQVRGGFGGFHGGGAGGFRAGGFRGGGVGERGFHAGGFEGGVRRDGVYRGDVAARGAYAFHGAGVNVRPWVRQPHYGRWVGGVALGALTTAAIAGVIPAGGGNGTCWYWSNSAQTRGYWDYC